MVMERLSVKKWYRVFTLFFVILSTPVVLYLFSLQLSSLVTFFLIIVYAGLLFLTVESFIISLKLSGDKISTIYFNISLSDIIDLENGIFETRIRTRWKVYRLPPIEDVENILRLVPKKD